MGRVGNGANHGPPSAVGKTATALAMTRGLVLEGGGAKGAYQFGCLLALAERGIAFDAIAGTSVGALNGALVAYDRLVVGQDYWRNLSPRRVVGLNYRWLPASFLVILFLA